jgi:HK97 family phage portal protein
VKIVDRPTSIPAVPRVRNNLVGGDLGKERRLRADQAGGWAAVHGRESNAGRQVSVESAMELSAVWACIRQTAQTISALPLSVYEKREGGSRQPVDDRLSEILTVTPNARQTAMEHWEGQIAWLLANGNCYAERIHTGRHLSALDPMPAALVEPILVGGELRYRVMDRGREETLPAEKVFHVRGFGFGGLKGLSAIRYGVQSMGAGLAAEEAAAKLFANGMQGSGFLKAKQTLSPDQRVQLQAMLSNYAGSSNAGKMMVLEAGLEWLPATLNPEDAQMLETRQFTIEDICRWFGVPPIVIGHSAKGQTMWGTGVEQILISWMSQGLNPLMRRIEARIRRDLIRPVQRNAYAEWNREGILQMESKAKSEFLLGLVNGGIMTPNEAREKLNLHRIEGGDSLLVQGAMITLDELLSRANAPQAPRT